PFPLNAPPPGVFCSSLPTTHAGHLHSLRQRKDAVGEEPDFGSMHKTPRAHEPPRPWPYRPHRYPRRGTPCPDRQPATTPPQPGVQDPATPNLTPRRPVISRKTPLPSPPTCHATPMRRARPRHHRPAAPPQYAHHHLRHAAPTRHARPHRAASRPRHRRPATLPHHGMQGPVTQFQDPGATAAPARGFKTLPLPAYPHTNPTRHARPPLLPCFHNTLIKL
ncbi:hypothetical protein H4582DRAFT_325151, partial [Lactarius indigo]